MTKATLFPRAKEYVGQKHIKSTIGAALASVAAAPICKAVYIESRGGSGKTFFLQQVHSLKDAPSGLRVAQIVDLYDSDARSGSAIERRLIDGLKGGSGEPYRFAPAEVDTAFADYVATRAEYDAERTILRPEEVKQRSIKLRSLFVQAYNTLAVKHPAVLCFDTTEALTSEPLKFPFLGDSFPTGAKAVAEWVEDVLPQLAHTLVIFAGRPVAGPGRAMLYEVCKRLGRLVEMPDDVAEVLSGTTNELLLQRDKLIPAQLSRKDIEKYFEKYGRADLGKQVEIAWKRTQGTPLLLTCLIQSFTNSQYLPAPNAEITTVPAFKDFLVTTLLDPLALGDSRLFSQQLLAYCLYILTYARRGISRSQLETLLRDHDWPRSHAEIEQDKTLLQQYTTLLDNLHDVALVKMRPETGLFYLHDEVYEMLDESGMPHALGFDDEVLPFLVEQAREQERNANTPAQRFTALSNRVYYMLVQKVDYGYRAYNLETYRLFNTSEVNQVLGLRDELQRWLNLTVTTFNESGEIVVREPNKDRVRDQKEKLTLDDIARDDAAWLVKYYLKSNMPAEAVRIGKLVQQHFASQLDGDDYFKLDLLMTIGNALAVWRDDTAEEALRYFGDAMGVLDKGQGINQKFLRDRQTFFRGELYTLAGFARRRLNDFDGASQYYGIAHKAYLECNDTEREDFDVPNALAQVIINQIYVAVHQGQLDRAKILSDSLLRGRYANQISADRAITALQMASLVLVRRASGNDLEEALRYAQQAETRSHEVQSRRTYAQAAAQIGSVRSERMQATEELDDDANTYFETAIAIFNEVQDLASLRTTLLGHGRYWRRYGRILRNRGDVAGAATYFSRALACFDAGLDALGPTGPRLYRAELLENKAVVYRLMGDVPETERLLNEVDILLVEALRVTYAQLIAAEVAFKRAQIALDREQWGKAAYSFTVALARCYCFSSENSTASLFRRRFKGNVEHLTEAGIVPLHQQVEDLAAQPAPPTSSLPYHQPEEVKWMSAWERAMEYVHETVAAIALTHGIL